MRIVNGQEIIVSPAASNWPPSVPARRQSGIVVSAVPRTIPRDPSRDPQLLRGRLVDILV